MRDHIYNKATLILFSSIIESQPDHALSEAYLSILQKWDKVPRKDCDHGKRYCERGAKENGLNCLLCCGSIVGKTILCLCCGRREL